MSNACGLLVTIDQGKEQAGIGIASLLSRQTLTREAILTPEDGGTEWGRFPVQ